MAEFINTIDRLGDDAVIDSIIDRTITEFKDNTLETVGEGAFRGCAALETVDMPNVTRIGRGAFANCNNIVRFVAQKLESIASYAGFLPTNWYYSEEAKKAVYDFGSLRHIGAEGMMNLYFRALIIRTPIVCTVQGGGLGYHNISPFGSGAYIYVPSALVDSYKSATTWSYYGDYIRAIEDYTVDGTTTGELDEAKI